MPSAWSAVKKMFDRKEHKHTLENLPQAERETYLRDLKKERHRYSGFVKAFESKLKGVLPGLKTLLVLSKPKEEQIFLSPNSMTIRKLT